MNKSILFSGLLTFLLCYNTYGQEKLESESIGISLIEISGGFHLPAGNLVKDFGASAAIGGSYQFKTISNWHFGLQSNFHFGQDVKNTDLLKNISTSSSDNQLIINEQGTLSDLQTYERGYSLHLTGSRLFPVIGPNPNSGIILKVGLGFLEHKIRIEGDERDLTYLSDEMKKGYDQLTNGISSYQFLGYYHLSNNRLINYFIGFESYQMFGKNRRGYSYANMSPVTENRTDILYGIKLGWVLPLYDKIRTTYYY